MYINLCHGNIEQENDISVMGSFYEVYAEIPWKLGRHRVFKEDGQKFI